MALCRSLLTLVWIRRKAHIHLVLRGLRAKLRVSSQLCAERRWSCPLFQSSLSPGQHERLLPGASGPAAARSNPLLLHGHPLSMLRKNPASSVESSLAPPAHSVSCAAIHGSEDRRAPLCAGAGGCWRHKCAGLWINGSQGAMEKCMKMQGEEGGFFPLGGVGARKTSVRGWHGVREGTSRRRGRHAERGPRLGSLSVVPPTVLRVSLHGRCHQPWASAWLGSSHHVANSSSG